MTASCLLSSTRNTITTKTYLPKCHYHYLNKEIKDGFLFKLQIPPIKPTNPILRLKTSKFTCPLASLSSFADADGQQPEEIITTHQHHNAEDHHHHHHDQGKEKSERLSGMAKAFNISSTTALAISVCIAFAALIFPLFMQSIGVGTPLKTKVLSYATLLLGFYMAWNIGANDVANAFGTSVGSGALTIRQAVLLAAVLEFSGALLTGTHVTSTMQKGILVANVFQGKDTLLFAGLLSSLAAAGTWLQVNIPTSLRFSGFI